MIPEISCKQFLSPTKDISLQPQRQGIEPEVKRQSEARHKSYRGLQTKCRPWGKTATPLTWEGLERGTQQPHPA